MSLLSLCPLSFADDREHVPVDGYTSRYIVREVKPEQNTLPPLEHADEAERNGKLYDYLARPTWTSKNGTVTTSRDEVMALFLANPIWRSSFLQFLLERAAKDKQELTQVLTEAKDLKTTSDIIFRFLRIYSFATEEVGDQHPEPKLAEMQDFLIKALVLTSPTTRPGGSYIAEMLPLTQFPNTNRSAALVNLLQEQLSEKKKSERLLALFTGLYTGSEDEREYLRHLVLLGWSPLKDDLHKLTLTDDHGKLLAHVLTSSTSDNKGGLPPQLREMVNTLYPPTDPVNQFFRKESVEVKRFLRSLNGLSRKDLYEAFWNQTVMIPQMFCADERGHAPRTATFWSSLPQEIQAEILRFAKSREWSQLYEARASRALAEAQKSESIEDLAQVIVLYPGSQQARAALFSLVDISLQRGDPSLAAIFYMKLITDYPNGAIAGSSESEKKIIENLIPYMTRIGGSPVDRTAPGSAPKPNPIENLVFNRSPEKKALFLAGLMVSPEATSQLIPQHLPVCELVQGLRHLEQSAFGSPESEQHAASDVLTNVLVLSGDSGVDHLMAIAENGSGAPQLHAMRTLINMHMLESFGDRGIALVKKAANMEETKYQALLYLFNLDLKKHPGLEQFPSSKTISLLGGSEGPIMAGKLRELGNRGIQVLQEAAHDRTARRAALTELSKLNLQQYPKIGDFYLKFSEQLLSKDDYYCDEFVAEALAKLGKPGINQLMVIAKKGSYQAQTIAFNGLLTSNEPFPTGFPELLVEKAADPMAMEALSKLDPNDHPELRSFFIRGTFDNGLEDDSAIMPHLVTALVKLGDQGIDKLMTVAEHPVFSRPETADHILTQLRLNDLLRNPTAAKFLVKMAKNGGLQDPAVANELAYDLAQLGGEGITILMEAAQSSEHEIERYQAIKILSFLDLQETPELSEFFLKIAVNGGLNGGIKDNYSRRLMFALIGIGNQGIELVKEAAKKEGYDEASFMIMVKKDKPPE
jgi:hypothetical protein